MHGDSRMTKPGRFAGGGRSSNSGLGSHGGIRRWAGAWSHIEEIVSHPVLRFRFVKRMMMDHDHLVFFLGGDWESLRLLVDLMREEFGRRAMQVNVGDRAEERLLSSFIFQG